MILEGEVKVNINLAYLSRNCRIYALNIGIINYKPVDWKKSTAIITGTINLTIKL